MSIGYRVTFNFFSIRLRWVRFDTRWTGRGFSWPSPLQPPAVEVLPYYISAMRDFVLGRPFSLAVPLELASCFLDFLHLFLSASVVLFSILSAGRLFSLHKPFSSRTGTWAYYTALTITAPHCGRQRVRIIPFSQSPVGLLDGGFHVLWRLDPSQSSE